MFKKLSIGLMLATVFSTHHADAFKSALSGKDHALDEHATHKGYALKSIDQLAILIDGQKQKLKDRFEACQRTPGLDTFDADITSFANMIGQLATTGIFDDGKGLKIDYGATTMPTTQQQRQLVTQGVHSFARFSDDAKGRFGAFLALTSSVPKPLQEAIGNILELAHKMALPKDMEKAMWLPTSNWKDANSYRTAIMHQTWAASEDGYIAEDGMIVLPAVKNPFQQALSRLPNAVVRDLSIDSNSEYFPNGIDKQTPKSCEHATKYQVIQGDSLDVARTLRGQINGGGKIAMLNMANSFTPGGGAWSGCAAQEEQLCFRSNLLKVLENHKGRGDYKSADGKFGISRRIDTARDCDSGIFTPAVTLFRGSVDNTGTSLPHYGFRSDLESFGMITSAAVDLNGVKTMPANYKDITKAKIRFQLRSAAVKGYTDLVLSAFGCGAFKGIFDKLQEDVATHYHEVLNEPEFKDRFENVVFGILVTNARDQANFDAFGARFK
ncbi:TIGR02452 family protein [Candidatus Finniella inopinata]|uniref:TIGR02452 family protein n=1 Tax=Candidatus Finniella inopinata TaxID=1696036 RepID=A0A4Q7DLA6_9PROT|nr:TIGR02452 family protein [Candidatus Finniella inopinata]RZI46944.1 TIGR02452 family protein [Candidatus Finniella inopinata]